MIIKNFVLRVKSYKILYYLVLKINRFPICSTEKYFTNPEVLRLTPYVCLLLGGCYTGLHLIGWLLIKEPPIKIDDSQETIEINKTSNVHENERSYGSVSSNDSHQKAEMVEDIFPKDALRTKEFYLVYFCRFLITPITQVTHIFSISRIKIFFMHILYCTKQTINFLIRILSDNWGLLQNFWSNFYR